MPSDPLHPPAGPAAPTHLPEPEHLPEPALEGLAVQAGLASDFLKTLANEGRLMILCLLVDGEKSVGELEQLVQVKQAAVSQQLARLRAEGLVSARRDGRLVWYSLLDPKAKQMIRLLHDMFCKQG